MLYRRVILLITDGLPRNEASRVAARDIRVICSLPLGSPFNPNRENIYT